MNNLLANPFVRHLVWSGVILPGFATLVASLILLVFVRVTQIHSRGGLWSLTLLSGLLTGYFAVYHDWSLWPHTVLGWLPILAIATVLLTGWTAHFNWGLRWLIALLMASAASGAMLGPVLRQTMTIATWTEVSVIAIFWWLLWVGSTSGQGEQKGAGASHLVLAVGLAVIGPLSQSILLGQLAMIFATSLGVVIVLLWVFPTNIKLTSPIGDLGALMLGILLIELWYYDAAPWAVILPMLVAATLGISAHRINQFLPSRYRISGLRMPAIVTAVPTIIGVYFAWQAYAASSGGY